MRAGAAEGDGLNAEDAEIAERGFSVPGAAGPGTVKLKLELQTSGWPRQLVVGVAKQQEDAGQRSGSARMP